MRSSHLSPGAMKKGGFFGFWFDFGRLFAVEAILDGISIANCDGFTT